MQTGGHVEIDLAEHRVLLRVVVVADHPHQIVGPEIGVEMRRAHRRVQRGIGVDRIAVDTLERRAVPRRRFVVVMRVLLIGEKRAGDPLDAAGIRRR